MSFKQRTACATPPETSPFSGQSKANVPVILGSATPPLSYHNAWVGRYRILRLPSRAAKKCRPAGHPLHRHANRQNKEGLSAPACRCPAEVPYGKLSRVWFYKPAGYAPVLLCKSCAWTAACQRCASRLVVHLKANILRCHHCGYQERFRSIARMRRSGYCAVRAWHAKD